MTNDTQIHAHRANVKIDPKWAEVQKLEAAAVQAKSLVNLSKAITFALRKSPRHGVAR